LRWVPEPEPVTVARIVKVQGRRGEVAAEILTDFPERFQPGQELLLAEGPAFRTLCLESSWFHKGRVVLKFAGVDSISQAKTLLGRALLIPRTERKALPPGSVYLSDLLGCNVFEGETNLGRVEAVEQTGGLILLRTHVPQGEILIPFAAEICREIDVEQKRIQVTLPQGLKDLNWTGKS